ncbi:MAG TPA: hypothetical protein VK961_14465, partial [Chthoniobacter sp.]|nr:hypothetical protein [Chthoniobacter sp.]
MRLAPSILILCAALGLNTLAQAQAPAAPAKPAKAPKDPNAGKRLGENKATPPERIKVMKDFKVELLYSVPFEEQGS